MAYKASYEADVKSSRQKVYATLMDFGGIEGQGVGAVRTIQLSEAAGFPGQVIERLDAAYGERLFAYSIMGVPSLPIDEYVAVVELSDTADGGCHVKWSSNWVTTGGMTEAEMAATLAGLYETLVGNI